MARIRWRAVAMEKTFSAANRGLRPQLILDAF